MSQPSDDRNPISPQTDPWELRERERARYARPEAASRTVSRTSGGESSSFNGESCVVAGLIVSIALLLLGDTPRIREDLRSLFIAAGSIVPFLLFAFVRLYVDDLRAVIRRGPNPWIAALLAWSLFAFYLSPFRQIAGFGLVGSDLVRVVSGVVLYLLAAYGLRSPKEISNTAIGIIFLATLVGLAEFYDIGGSQQQLLTHYVRLNTIFGSHEGLGTLLMLALPLPLAFVLSRETEEKRRLAALAATIILGTALLLARTRSAWIGMTVAFLLLLLFNYWTRDKARSSQPLKGASLHRRGSAVVSFLTAPATLVALALVGVLLFSGVAAFIQSRASIRIAINDSESRFDLWKAGARMVWDRPLTGWGLGSFLILQGRWSHIGDDVAAVITHGADEKNNAHNYYVQWAADTGAVGLILHVAVLTAFLIAGTQGLWNLRGSGNAASKKVPPFQRTLLAGCVAAFAAGCVDSVTSPSYTFHSLAGIFWVLMGLGVAALRPISSVSESSLRTDVPVAVPALLPTRLWGVPPIAGAAAAAIVLFAGYQQTLLGKKLPRGVFQIKVENQKKGPVRPGERVLWRAVYRDHTGRTVNTYPGTIWEFSTSDSLALEQMKRSVAFSRFGQHPKYDSLLSVTGPSGSAQPITAHAAFFDVYGRRYDAWSSVIVARAAAAALPRK